MPRTGLSGRAEWVWEALFWMVGGNCDLLLAALCLLSATTKPHRNENNGWARIDIRAERSEQETVSTSEESWGAFDFA
ncbi:hypothetical protein Mal35_58270 [Gimesia maris]|uniref:hypothetical protein n=1 Tax=Gimesia maris TaxID=122 RepID=UPI001187ED3A|nr:hypothetical protein [Gimesia maris]QDT82334.1 hypothetical protein Mal35_58270 [Gimesia maris]